MKRSLSVSLVLILITFGLPTNSYASSNGEALVWKPYPIGPAFELGSYNHTDVSKKIKWYSWNPDDKYFVSFARPFTIRLAQEVKITDKNANCTSVPIKVRREISEREVRDTLNQTSIQFFQADFGFNKAITPSQIISRPIIYTVDPSSWKDKVDQEINLHVPICSDSIGKSLSELVGNEITINLRLSYSTNVDENLANIDPKCSEILGSKCMFYSRVASIFKVKFNQSSLNLENLKYAYQEEIDKEKDYLQTKPCDVPYASYDKQSNSNIMVKDNKALCESSQRNLDFLNSEIARASKLLQPTPISTVSPKLTKITCTKGKLTKKVSGTNPKCPKGYKKAG
jgi:hypothetical protein